MNWWNPHKFREKQPFLEARARLLKAVRAFFDDSGFLEVETPALQTSPGMDTHIHAFKTGYFGPDLRHRRDFYLHTSPEFTMKKLLVAGLPKIYQLCHVFRNGEETRLHSPEFTMLEWYRVPGDYEDMMKDCIGLLRSCAIALGITHYRHKDMQCDPFGEWQKISVVEAFKKYAGIDLAKYIPPHPSPLPTGERGAEHSEAGEGTFREAAEKVGIRTTNTDRWDDIFHAVMAEKIEPHLGMETPCILYDYPANMAMLSKRKKDDPRFAGRFELYVCGVELANAFSELTDATEQRKRFEADMKQKKEIYGLEYPVDEDFLAALEHGLPESGGIALGIDRLVMLASGAENIDQVLWTGTV